MGLLGQPSALPSSQSFLISSLFSSLAAVYPERLQDPNGPWTLSGFIPSHSVSPPLGVSRPETSSVGTLLRTSTRM